MGVHGKLDFKIYHDIMIPHVKPEIKEVLSYQTFELVLMIHVPMEAIVHSSEMSKSVIMSGKVLMKN